MTREDKKDFEQLKEYVKKELLQYDDIMKMSPYFTKKITKLATNDTKELIYNYKMILYGFMINKDKILYAFSHKSFTDEKHKINYMIAIISQDMNDIKQKVLSRQQQKNKCNLDIEQAQYLYDRNMFTRDERYCAKTTTLNNEEELWKI